MKKQDVKIADALSKIEDVSISMPLLMKAQLRVLALGLKKMEESLLIASEDKTAHDISLVSPIKALNKLLDKFRQGVDKGVQHQKQWLRRTRVDFK